MKQTLWHILSFQHGGLQLKQRSRSAWATLYSKFWASLSYIVKPCLKNKSRKKKRKKKTRLLEIAEELTDPKSS